MSSTRRLLVVVAAVISAAGVGVALRTDRVLIADEFTTSAQGWLVSSDTGSHVPDFNAAGGNPGGFISSVDEALGETWYFRAPDRWLKALSAADGGTLAFDLRQSTDEPGFLDDDVVIVGPAGRLSYRFPASPTTKWTASSVPLSPSAGWRWNWNSAATREQMRQVLKAATSLEIRGEYHTGDDMGGLDNVVLKAGG